MLSAGLPLINLQCSKWGRKHRLSPGHAEQSRKPASPAVSLLPVRCLQFSQPCIKCSLRCSQDPEDIFFLLFLCLAKGSWPKVHAIHFYLRAALHTLPYPTISLLSLSSPNLAMITLNPCPPLSSPSWPLVHPWAILPHTDWSGPLDSVHPTTGHHWWWLVGSSSARTIAY